MKRKAMAIAFSILFASSAYAQIPVTDGLSIAKDVANQVETIQQWTNQYKQMISQIDQMKEQYSSLTGSRNLGEIFNDQSLKNYLPEDWQNVYDSVRSGGYSGLSGSASSIYNANKVYDACGSISDSSAKTSCEARAVKPAQDKANALAAMDASKKRLSQIDSLMQQINTTQDPKAIAELGARINAEQAMIQNEQTKLNLYAMVSSAEDKLQEQRAKEINAKANARKGYATLPDPSF